MASSLPLSVIPQTCLQRQQQLATGPKCCDRRTVVRLSQALAPIIPDVTLKQNTIGHSDLVVSEACLGTMVFGSQVQESDAHKIMDYGYERGLNFFDTAEMYSVPQTRDTHGNSSRIVGSWMKGKKRDNVVIATKLCGRGKSEMVGYVAANRTEPPGEASNTVVNLPNARAAVEGELRRLGTDYIDIMQIHWPDRYVPFFGETKYRPEREYDATSFEEQAAAMGELIKEGKIRYWGLSNETTFGTMAHCMAADKVGVPRPISIQNSYSLTHRSFDTELAEACSPSNLNIGLLPYFAAAAGVLSGKYLNNKKPEGARMQLWGSYLPRFFSDQMDAAIAEYVRVAEAAGMTGVQLAYLFCKSRWFIPSTIIGASTLEQMEENLLAFGFELSDDVLAAVDEVHLRYPNPQNTD